MYIHIVMMYMYMCIQYDDGTLLHRLVQLCNCCVVSYCVCV